MAEGKILSIALAVIGSILNIIFYIICTFGVFSLVYTVLAHTNLADLFTGITVGCLFSGALINAIIQNMTLDKEFKPVISAHQNIVRDGWGTPPSIIVRLGIVRACYYAGAILSARLGRHSAFSIVNYLANNEDFKASVKQLNIVSAYIFLVMFILTLISGILAIAFNYI